ncbi:hypothetical protein H6P81_001892 [Aristolochia fimbriata]|uniref:HTH three-helical bundle domain-containing protein n=1 Tax=Aristolochia fimbriata TaxID=158543 RepID=A0AAV7F9R4_ARIFI|nr:hypothetical protein H6P81_001892 [Aristolochia fimbriata]
MEADPNSSDESTAAEALLSLSSCFSAAKGETSLRFSGFSTSASSSSAATAESPGGAIRRDPLTLLAMAAYYVEKDGKAKKGRRSRTYKISANSGTSSGGEEVSAQSTTSTTASRSLNYRKVIVKSGWTWRRVMFCESRRKITGTSLRRRASAILQLLSSGRSSETRIRRELGDSPDTSKALRLLLQLDEVKRYGSGGRRDPFVYEVTGARSDVESA